MTEAEWMTEKEVGKLVAWLPNESSHRKLRLFAIECCKAIDTLLDHRGRTALQIAEQVAEGVAVEDRLADGERLANEAFVEFFGVQEYAAECVVATCASKDLFENVIQVAGITSTLVDVGIQRAMIKATKRLNRHRQSRILRDLFGNPFRSTAFDLTWRTSTAIGLAEAIYADRAFDQMPILADALQDAGCEDADILDHCRGPGPHVRGCWVVDVVLGKS